MPVNIDAPTLPARYAIKNANHARIDNTGKRISSRTNEARHEVTPRGRHSVFLDHAYFQ